MKEINSIPVKTSPNTQVWAIELSLEKCLLVVLLVFGIISIFILVFKMFISIGIGIDTGIIYV